MLFIYLAQHRNFYAFIWFVIPLDRDNRPISYPERLAGIVSTKLHNIILAMKSPWWQGYVVIYVNSGERKVSLYSTAYFVHFYGIIIRVNVFTK